MTTRTKLRISFTICALSAILVAAIIASAACYLLWTYPRWIIFGGISVLTLGFIHTLSGGAMKSFEAQEEARRQADSRLG